MPSLSFRLLPLLAATTALCACQQPTTWPGGAPQDASGAPMTTAPVEAVEAVPMADQSFIERLNHLEQNVGGLEADVAGLQTQMTAAQPKLDKVDKLEGSFKQLSLQLDRIDKSYPKAAAAPKTIKPAPAKNAVTPKLAPKALPPVATAPKAAGAKPKIEGVRIGEQAGGKTRIVLDATAPAKIKYDIDNTEKILVIEIPGASWSAATARTLSNSPLVTSYTAETDAAGSRLIVQLKQAAKVTVSGQVDPDRTGGNRSYLDLQRL